MSIGSVCRTQPLVTSAKVIAQERLDSNDANQKFGAKDNETVNIDNSFNKLSSDEDKEEQRG